eukprot:GHVS01040033.1.p1 GENE.GHVS01040033.1~~GHVS01040033.1.p1  ORF type:complete len:615 (-),score=76.12 GHVS01040033.1:1670-3385(-)
MSQTGIFLGIFLLCLDSVVCFITTYILSDSVHLFKCRTYACLAEQLVGKWLGLAVDGLVSFNGFGVSATLMVFLGDFTPPVIRLIYSGLAPTSWYPPPWWLTNRAVVLTTAVVLVWPLAVKKHISGLRNFSVLPVVAISLTGLMVIIDAPRLYASHSDEYVVYANLNWNVFKSFNIFLFAFMQHVNTCLISDEIRNPTNTRVIKILYRSVLLEFILYFCISVFGYVSWMSHTKQNFVNNYSEDDRLFSACRVALMLSMLVAIPVNNIAAGRSMVGIYTRWQTRWRRRRNQGPSDNRTAPAPAYQPPAVTGSSSTYGPIAVVSADNSHSLNSNANNNNIRSSVVPAVVADELNDVNNSSNGSSPEKFLSPASELEDNRAEGEAGAAAVVDDVGGTFVGQTTGRIGKGGGWVGMWRRGRDGRRSEDAEEENGGGDYVICSGGGDQRVEEDGAGIDPMVVGGGGGGAPPTRLQHNDDNNTNAPRLIAVTSCLFVSYLIALMTDRVADIVALLGGIISTCLMCLFPSLIYYKGLGQLHTRSCRLTVFLFLQAVSLFGICSSVIIILQALNICCTA